MWAKEKLTDFIAKHQLLTAQDKVLLAVSGGKDSMLMANLFLSLGYNCCIAHCNFQLRGEESDLDEQLVREYADKLGFPVHVKTFDTETYAHVKGLSIQMAARELRYLWFEEIRQLEKAHYIAIAQHQNDHLETALFNLTRSTGLKGLLGIAIKREKIIRPLLCFSAKEIAEAVKDLEIPFRDDQSNFSSKYARNKIRIEIIPKFQEIQPNFESIMLENMKHFEESQQFIQKIVDQKRNEIFQEDGSYVRILRTALKNDIHDAYLLFELFKPYGFQKNILKEMAAVWDKPMGQIFQSDSHELLLDRDSLLLRKRKAEQNTELAIIDDLEQSISFQGHTLGFEYLISSVEPENNSIEKIDADKLILPLRLRNWKLGDVFIPLGMTGKKKVSDFLIQQKVNRFEKENVSLLINANDEVIWVIGYRLDNRFKVTENTKKVLTLVFN